MTYATPEDYKLHVQLSQDCIFFESTEELYKFFIKIPDTEFYGREERWDNEDDLTIKRVAKDGLKFENGTVWRFEENETNVRKVIFLVLKI